MRGLPPFLPRRTSAHTMPHGDPADNSAVIRLGFMINDNDLPGSETFDPIVWPVTYGTFERWENSAVATCE